MIISCEKCKAKYMVPPNSLGKDGRSVKCAKCAHSWFAKPTSEEIEKSKFAVEPPKDKFSHDQSKLPALPPTKLHKVLTIIPMVLMGVILILTTIFYENVITIIPGTRTLYELAGAFSTDGLSFRNVAIRKIETNTGRNLLLRGQIYNHSEKELTIPYIRLIIFDQDSRIMKNFIQAPQNIVIKSGEFYPFNFTLSPVGRNANTVMIDIGNRLDLFLR